VPPTSRSLDEAPWRTAVGGLWDEIGRLQYELLLGHGLRPRHRLLDVGCGCLRGGVHFVRHLEDGHYYGIDSDSDLLDKGREIELPRAGLGTRRVHLACRDDFDASDFEVGFDFALAQSLFTHLPGESIALCLARVGAVLADGGRFFATFFEAPAGKASLAHPLGGVTSYRESDPYHQTRADFEAWSSAAGLEVTHHGDFGHPRDQRLLEFRPIR